MYIVSVCVYSLRCIRGILSDKIVILVTHQVQYLERCDAILGLKEVSNECRVSFIKYSVRVMS